MMMKLLCCVILHSIIDNYSVIIIEILFRANWILIHFYDEIFIFKGCIEKYIFRCKKHFAAHGCFSRWVDLLCIECAFDHTLNCIPKDSICYSENKSIEIRCQRAHNRLLRKNKKFGSSGNWIKDFKERCSLNLRMHGSRASFREKKRDEKNIYETVMRENYVASGSSEFR